GQCRTQGSACLPSMPAASSRRAPRQSARRRRTMAPAGRRARARVSGAGPFAGNVQVVRAVTFAEWRMTRAARAARAASLAPEIVVAVRASLRGRADLGLELPRVPALRGLDELGRFRLKPLRATLEGALVAPDFW